MVYNRSMAAALPITTNPGTQFATGTPQAAAGPSGETAAQSSGRVQPGITGSSLNSTQGVPLSVPALTTVDLAVPAASGQVLSTSQGASTQPAATNQAGSNLMLIGLPILLAVIAIALFFMMRASARKTPDYQ